MTTSQEIIIKIFDEPNYVIHSFTPDNTFTKIANEALALSNRDFGTNYQISTDDVKVIIVKMKNAWPIKIQFLLKEPNSQSPLFDFLIKYKPGLIRNGIIVKDTGVDNR